MKSIGAVWEWFNVDDDLLMESRHPKVVGSAVGKIPTWEEQHEELLSSSDESFIVIDPVVEQDLANVQVMIMNDRGPHAVPLLDQPLSRPERSLIPLLKIVTSALRSAVRASEVDQIFHRGNLIGISNSSRNLGTFGVPAPNSTSSTNISAGRTQTLGAEP